MKRASLAPTSKREQRSAIRAPDAGTAITRHGVVISSPARLQYRDARISKRDLADYYEYVADRILPRLRGRPMTVIRCPRGVDQRCFIQQHVTKGFPKAVHRVHLTEASGKIEEHFYVEDLAGILACVQIGVLEFHAWGSRVDALEKPDRLVFDLDPDPGLPFSHVIRAARLIRERLAADGLESWPMLTGGKGIHVVASIRPSSWQSVRAYAKRLAQTAADEQPERFTASSSKSQRRKRIYIDYLRNERGITAIVPYSTRAKAGAPVAMPLGWDALDDARSASTFNVRRVLEEGVPKFPRIDSRSGNVPNGA